MHTQQKARAKVVGLVEAPRKAHGGDAAERVSGEVGGSPLRGAATWAEEVEKSPRFFTLWKEKRVEEEKALERGRSCLGFASSWWKSACVRDAFLVTDPSFPFFHPD